MVSLSHLGANTVQVTRTLLRDAELGPGSGVWGNIPRQWNAREETGVTPRVLDHTQARLETVIVMGRSSSC